MVLFPYISREKKVKTQSVNYKCLSCIRKSNHVLATYLPVVFIHKIYIPPPLKSPNNYSKFRFSSYK